MHRLQSPLIRLICSQILLRIVLYNAPNTQESNYFVCCLELLGIVLDHCHTNFFCFVLSAGENRVDGTDLRSPIVLRTQLRIFSLTQPEVPDTQVDAYSIFYLFSQKYRMASSVLFRNSMVVFVILSEFHIHLLL